MDRLVFATGYRRDYPVLGEELAAPLAEVACPVLAIHGSEDEYGSVEHARRIAGARGELCLMEGVGHAPHREAEAAATRRVAAFLSGLP